jgi:hypothetical protein
VATPKQTDTLTQLAQTALAADSTLKERTQKMFGQALQRAQYILDFGTDQERSALIKAIVPQMMRSLQDEQADVEAKAQRAAYERMREAMRGGPPGKRARKK